MTGPGAFSAPITIDPEVLAHVTDRGIQEVRHFTTNRGVAGVLASRRLLCRSMLSTDQVLEYIAMHNCYRRWDEAWFGHVNLSITSINGYLYGISSNSWHIGEDLWWAVLGFAPEVLAHTGVVFSTTNNGYSVTRRASGALGFDALFAERVQTWRGGGPAWVLRTDDHRLCDPTDPQAEALYPRGVSTEFLRHIYVPQPELVDSVSGILAFTGHSDVPVKYEPEAFQ